MPGAFLNAPLALLIIVAGTVRLEPEALLPIGMSVRDHAYADVYPTNVRTEGVTPTEQLMISRSFPDLLSVSYQPHRHSAA